MRMFFLFLGLLVAQPAQATQWFCQSALESGDPLRSEYEFRMILHDGGAFDAEGRRDNTGFGWAGTYAQYDNEIAMIGTVDGPSVGPEMRAVSEVLLQDIIILSLKNADERSIAIRCLRHELR